jgi:hypothetical protein
LGWKRSTTRAIPSPIKTSDRTSTRPRHQTKKGMAEQYITTPRMRLLRKAAPMTPFRSILDNHACDGEWKRLGVTSKRRVEEWLDTLVVTTSELD